MQKPHKITAAETPQDVERIDDLFSILFRQGQGKEHTLLEITGAGVWPGAGLDAAVIPERNIILCYNSTDGAYRVYTKIKDVLKYIAWI